MSNYNSSDTFQQSGSTGSNGYNLFPSAYQSTKVGGKRSAKSTKKTGKKGMKKGGNCGCNKINLFSKGGAKRSKTHKNKKTPQKK